MPHLVTLPDGELAVIRCNPDLNEEWVLAKTMFELSRTTDMTTHFDPNIHTLDNIHKGLDGHCKLDCRPCAEDDIPTDRSQRDQWCDTGTRIVIR